MDLGALLLILTVIVLVSMFVSRPFFRPQTLKTEAVKTSEPQNEHNRSALLAERDRIINSLQELDFDNALGKIPEEEYPAQRAELLQNGANILRQLDTYTHESANQAAEDRLEAAIAARRADLARRKAAPAATRSEKPVTTDVEIERLVADRRKTHTAKPGGFCPKCGRQVQKADRFCPKCGVSLGKNPA